MNVPNRSERPEPAGRELRVVRNNSRDLPAMVDVYARADYLEAPEELVLESLRGRLGEIRMLDVGIGGGRTTSHFAPLVREYVGIDMDEGMVEACRKRFPGLAGNVTLLTCDARSMPMFADGSFDFVLFSFNGIDYLSHDERMSALREIKRVGAPGGTFLFSSHNLNRVEDQFRIRRTRDPRLLARSLWAYLLMRCRNRSLRALRRMDHAIVNDGSYNRRLSWLIASFRERLGYYYFIRPAAQLSQLAEIGLPGARVYSLSGRELVTPNDFVEAPDHWLYYLCSL